MKFLILILIVFFSFDTRASGGFRLWKLSPRPIYIYLPDGYGNNKSQRYPVLYMHDGQNLFDPSRAFMGQTWQAEETLNKLIKNKTITPLIVVAIDSTANRIFEYTPDIDPEESPGGGALDYLKLIKDEIKPRIDSEFKTIQDPRMTGLCGSSLGGLVSLYGGIVYPETFGLIGALSPSFWWNKRSIFNYFERAQALPHKIYMDFGTNENNDLTDINDFTELLLNRDFKKNQNLKVILQEGASHREFYWAQRFPETLKFLFPKVL